MDKVIYNGHTYGLVITKKRIKSIIFKYDEKTDTIKVSAPYLTSQRRIEKSLQDCLPKLFKKLEKVNHPAYTNGYLRILGDELYVGEMSQEEINAYYKKKAEKVFSHELDYYSSLMKVSPKYKLKIRSMTTRYGVNNKRDHSITLQLELIQYSLDIIDSVIIHELAHHFVFNHSKQFYDIVYKYCPDYKILRKKLINKIYK